MRITFGLLGLFSLTLTAASSYHTTSSEPSVLSARSSLVSSVPTSMLVDRPIPREEALEKPAPAVVTSHKKGKKRKSDAETVETDVKPESTEPQPKRSNRSQKETAPAIAEEKPNYAITVGKLMTSLGGIDDKKAAEHINNLWDYVCKKEENPKIQEAITTLTNFGALNESLPAFSNYSPCQILAGLWAYAEQLAPEEDSSTSVLSAGAAAIEKKPSPREDIFSTLTKEIEPLAMLEEMLEAMAPHMEEALPLPAQIHAMARIELNDSDRAMLANLMKVAKKHGFAPAKVNTYTWDNLVSLMIHLGFTANKDRTFTYDTKVINPHYPHSTGYLYDDLMSIWRDQMANIGFDQAYLQSLLG